MTNLEVVKPQVIDGIEFYVNNDGSCSGLSISGLARLCGVSRKAISLLVNALDGGSTVAPKQLEPLRGIVFLVEVKGEAIGGFDEAKIVHHAAAAKIIKYYACDSKAANDMAKVALDRFIEKGLDSWIKEVTGYSERPVISSDGILEALKLLTNEVKNLSVKVEKMDTFHKATVTNLPGLNQMFGYYSNSELGLDSTAFTLKDWLATKGITLDKSNMCSLSRLVSDAYKFNRQAMPEKQRQNLHGAVGKGFVCVYRASDVPLLEVSLRKHLG